MPIGRPGRAVRQPGGLLHPVPVGADPAPLAGPKVQSPAGQDATLQIQGRRREAAVHPAAAGLHLRDGRAVLNQRPADAPAAPVQDLLTRPGRVAQRTDDDAAADWRRNAQLGKTNLFLPFFFCICEIYLFVEFFLLWRLIWRILNLGVSLAKKISCKYNQTSFFIQNL